MTDQRSPFADPWGLTPEEPSGEASPPGETTEVEEPAEDEPVEEETQRESAEEEVEPIEEEVEPVEDEVEQEPAEDEVSEEQSEEQTVAPDVISTAHIEAKNVLDALGADLDDLPDEPPEWVEEPSSVSPPSVYKELTSLGRDHEPVEAVSHDAIDEPAIEEDEEDLDTTVEAAIEEADESEEADLDAALQGAIDSVETVDTTEETELETDAAESEPETGLDAALKQAMNAVQPEAPEEPDEADTDLDATPHDTLGEGEPEETDLDAALKQAMNAVQPEAPEEPDEVDTDLDATPHDTLGEGEPEEAGVPDQEPDDTTFEPHVEVSPGEPDVVVPADRDEAASGEGDDFDAVVREAIGAVEPVPEEPIEPEPPIEPIEPEAPEEEGDFEFESTEQESGDLETVLQEAIDSVEPGDEELLIESPTVAWGSNWGSAAQGWVQQEGGRSTWRPIVTTTSDVGSWEIDTFLGIVSGDATISDVGHLPGAREAALRSLIDEALSRGAHAVVGVRTEVHHVGQALLFSAVGTAVTLRNPT